MCCSCNRSYNNNRCCYHCQGRIIFQYSTLPQNNTTILRPITPVNPAFTNNALYAVGDAGYVNNMEPISLTQGAGTPGTTLTVNNNNLIIPSGTYQISYGITAIGPTSSTTTPTVQLYANGVGVPNEILSDNARRSLPGNAVKTIIYTAAAPTALSLYNITGARIRITNAFITAQKLT